jgi:hypothetical protein
MDAFDAVTSAAYIFLMFLSSMFYGWRTFRAGSDGLRDSIR